MASAKYDPWDTAKSGAHTPKSRARSAMISLKSTIFHAEQPVGFGWAYYLAARRGGGPGAWVRLHAHEEERLEAALVSGAVVVPISGERAEAHLSPSLGPDGGKWAGVIQQRYLEMEPLPLARVRWCYKPRNGRWQPLTPADDAALEAALAELLLHAAAVVAAGAADDSTVETSSCADGGDGLTGDAPSAPIATQKVVVCEGAYEVTLTRTAEAVTVEMRGTTSESWLGRPQCSLSRGWAGEALRKMNEEEVPLAVDFDWTCYDGTRWRGAGYHVASHRPWPSHRLQVRVEGRRPSALVLVVHGVGESLWKRDNSLK
jgi:hypothetical protein